MLKHLRKFLSAMSLEFMNYVFDVNQTIWLIVFSVYAAAITIITKKTYEIMINRGIEKYVAVYYNRKIIHMAAGGVVVLLVPLVFTNPFYPLIIGAALTLFTIIPHKTGNIRYWFQTDQNWNDVNFCFMWAVIVFILWIIIGDPWIAVIPPAFMAFGDGITGVVRNALFKKRTKHYAGNLFMLIVCLALGYFLGAQASTPIPVWGVLSAFVATFVERYEFGPIDDNVLITVFASIVLYIGFYLTTNGMSPF